MSEEERDRRVDEFFRHMVAEGASPGELLGQMIGNVLMKGRELGVTKEIFMRACEGFWNQSDPKNN